MYNISPREGERYFPRALLLYRSGIRSYKEMSNVDGVQHPSFRETCCAMGLLADDAEWMRCLKDAFAKRFESLTIRFATIVVLSEPFSPVSLWNKNIASILADLRKRYTKFPEAQSLLQSDKDAKEYATQEVQDVLKKATTASL